ncbi:MAG: NUDIX hydrolase [Lachnospiraceae bacterium]|nr:NUDIX hydrolase [Robinsoniella sp.]MDY3767859.1 NUDIX hydrolase [Lachnospiraceae bacterium]
MPTIKKISKLTDNRHLNLYQLEAINRVGEKFPYFVASRAKNIEDLKIKTRNHTPDGVIIYSVYGEKRDKVVLVRQYRYALDDYIYEFPAGLVEPDEDFKTAGIRELKEETGLDLQPITVDPMYEKPYFTTIGMTDECCATVYGYASGEVSKKGQEDSEDIEIVLADRAEVERILKEERVAIMCAYMLMHFLKEDGDPFAFLK